MSDFIIVYVTTQSKAEAEKIAQTLLNEHLIACANIIGPVSSHFHWDGKIDNVEEFLMLLKSRKDLFLELEKRVRALHSYSVPEILAVPVVDGSNAYFEWMRDALKKP